jgi:hypothetical protein
MLFSQRKGIKPGKSVIQIDDMDDDLRNSLWNALTLCFWNYIETDFDYSSVDKTFISNLWVYHFKKPLDSLSKLWSNAQRAIKRQYDNLKWYEVYDFIEYVANNNYSNSNNKKFIKLCNSFLESELSAYRFVEGKITQITSQEEISEIEEAKKSPDYRNSIKESISAVEAICKLITKKKKPDLGQALKILENKIGLHPALKKSFSNLYGYTSDAKGIRHALLEETELYPEDAKFMLVSCSAFVNYLVSKISKTKLKI